jgi:predicted ATPase/DNA-binding SARP family transcriptional activator
MITTLQIHTLGGVSIQLNENRLRFDARSAEALLIYLACHGQPLGREVLAEFFWPDRTPDQARTNLRVALHRLRQQLGPYLAITRQQVALAPDASVALDCAQFEAHLAAGALAAASARYTGDFLADFYVDGSPAFEQWALFERERLRSLAFAAFQQRIEQQTAAGELTAAIAVAQRLLQLDPLHEPTHRQLMRLLAQTGQRSAAFTQYETCRHLLATELAVTPAEVTTVLVEQIRTGAFDQPPRMGAQSGHGAKEIVQVQPVSLSPEPPVSHTRTILPPQCTPFIGREAELAQIDQLLANPDCRLLTLLGVGGIGKTRLVIEAASRQSACFADGVYFVSLAAIAAEFLPTTLAQCFNLTLHGKDLVAQLSHHLRSRHLLLVLDNFEHLLPWNGNQDAAEAADAANLLAMLLRQAPRLKVLVTSRTRLQLLEEWLLPVDGLALGGNLLGAAAQLFLRSAQRVQPAFSAEGQGEAIVTICQQVGGMPLAIELAASWVRCMSCTEIANQLAHNFDLLSTVVRNLPERHRSIRTLFDQSWRLLSLEEQVALRRLSVFQDGWTFAEAHPLLLINQDRVSDELHEQWVNGQSPHRQLLLGLVDKSLVRSNGQGRFALHELVRQYASEQLVLSGERELICQRHFTVYLALARRADAKLRGPEVVTWFHRLESEQGNLRAALQWALAQERYEDVVWMGMALSFFWQRKIRWRETYTWLAPTLAYAQALPLELQLANLLNLHGYWLMESTQDVERYAHDVAELAQRCISPLLRAHAFFVISSSRRDATQSATLNAQAIHLLRQAASAEPLPAEFCLYSEPASFLAYLLSRQGRMLCNGGEYTQATTYFLESLAIFRAINNRSLIFYPLGNLGYLALKQGDLAQAQPLLREAAELVQTVGDTLGIFQWQPLLALLKLYQGDWAEAWRLLHVCLVDTDLRHTHLPRKAQAVAALLKLAQGEFEEAAAFLQVSMSNYYHHRQIRPELVDGLFTAARLAAAQQQWVRAATLFGLAEHLRVEIRHNLDAPLYPWVEAALATVRGALEPEVFVEAFAVGQQLSLEEAYATILAPSQVVGVPTLG